MNKSNWIKCNNVWINLDNVTSIYVDEEGGTVYVHYVGNGDYPTMSISHDTMAVLLAHLEELAAD